MPDEAKQGAINTLLNSTRQAMRFTQAMDLAQIDAILTMPDITRVNTTSGAATSTNANAPPPGASPSAPGAPAPAPVYYDPYYDQNQYNGGSAGG